MTTIATDGKTVAYDTHSWRHFTVNTCPVDKAIMLPDGRIAAACGNYEDAKTFFEWLAQTCLDPSAEKPKLSDEANFDGLVVDPKSGRAWSYEAKFHPLEPSLPFCIGAGGMIARGAMEFGASPEQAVKCSISVGPHNSGGEVRVLPRNE